MRPTLSWLAVAALSVLLLSAACGKPARPSVILISMDTIRADHMSVYGYERQTTPRLDAFAAECTVWDHAYTTASWTLIAHMGMFTGLWPHQHGVIGKEDALAENVPTLAERLQAQGYDTMAFYRPGWIHERHGFARGFRVFEPHLDAREAQEDLARLLPTADPDKPLFLFVHLFDAHSAVLEPRDSLVYTPPAPYDRMFLADAPDRFRAGDALRLFNGKQKPTPEQVEGLTALYDGGLSYVDEVVGTWLEEWRQSGLLDRALTIITADHGEALAQRQLQIDGHGEMWEEGLRVPFLLRLPHAAQAGRRIQSPISHVDIVPTVLAELDLARDPWLVGYDLQGPRPKDSIVAAERPPTVALVQWPRKLVTSLNAESGRMSDLSTDLAEMHPIFGRPNVPDFVAERERMLAAYMQQLAERPKLELRGAQAEALSAEELEQIEKLGYAGELEDH